jgi:hypothetical protein
VTLEFCAIPPVEGNATRADPCVGRTLLVHCPKSVKSLSARDHQSLLFKCVLDVVDCYIVGRARMALVVGFGDHVTIFQRVVIFCRKSNEATQYSNSW